MGPELKVRKTRVRQDLGKKVTVGVSRMPMAEAITQAALSKTGKSWSAVRITIAQALNSKTPPTTHETVAIEFRVDNRPPTQDEAKSMETTINRWLETEVRSPFRAKYLETNGKIVLLHKDQFMSLFGRAKS